MVTVERSHLNNSSTKMDNAVGCGWGIMFIEKLVPIVVNLFLEAPQNERFNSSPEVIRCLGRYFLCIIQFAVPNKALTKKVLLPLFVNHCSYIAPILQTEAFL